MTIFVKKHIKKPFLARQVLKKVISWAWNEKYCWFEGLETKELTAANICLCIFGICYVKYPKMDSEIWLFKKKYRILVYQSNLNYHAFPSKTVFKTFAGDAWCFKVKIQFIFDSDIFFIKSYLIILLFTIFGYVTKNILRNHRNIFSTLTSLVCK